MIRPRSLPTLLACGALVVIVNAFVLGAAAWNRSGGRAQEITLTERELALPEFRQDESSGLELTLRLASEPPEWVFRELLRRRLAVSDVSYPWLDAAKLRSLGFRLPADAGDAAGEHGGEARATRTAFIALELDGDSWKPLLAAREEAMSAKLSPEDATAVSALDRTMRSRLVPVDADTDAAALRARYPDRARYLIAQGVVRAVRKGSVWQGRIPELVQTRIRVPRELAPSLAKFLPKETEDEVLRRQRESGRTSWPEPRPPRYRAVVAFGRRYDPWLVSVSVLAEP